MNISNTSFLFHSLTSNKESSLSIGASVSIVPNTFDKNAKSLLFSRFSFCLPLNPPSPFSKSSYIFSKDPCSFISPIAVFSPIPGTPGILSEVSPWSPFTSIKDFGSNPYSSNIFALS